MIKSKKIRTAIVGLGRIGWQFHLPNVSANEGFELVAVVDPLADRVNEVTQKYRTKGFLECRSMLEQIKPDLVVVASPTPFHKAQSIEALNAGCDVLCEKPAAMNLSEFESILGVVEATGRKFTTYQPYRGYSETLAIKDILSRNLIGDVYMIKRSWLEYGRRNDWQSLKKYGGGMLNNYGAHFIDQLLYLSDYKANKISCVARNIASPGDAEDFAKITVETEKKVILDIEINLASAHSLAPWQILGKTGSIILDEQAGVWEVKYCDPNHIENLEVQQSLAAQDRIYRNGKPINWNIERFKIDNYVAIDYYEQCYKYFAIGEEPIVPITQAHELMRVIDLCGKLLD